jgi:hypothetical protein
MDLGEVESLPIGALLKHKCPEPGSPNEITVNHFLVVDKYKGQYENEEDTEIRICLRAEWSTNWEPFQWEHTSFEVEVLRTFWDDVKRIA